VNVVTGTCVRKATARRKARWAATLTAVTALGALSGVAAAGPAHAAPTAPFGNAFMLVTSPGNPAHIPAPEFQWNSAHPWQAVNTVVRNDVGSYTASLPDLGSDSGTALVTAFANQADTDPNPNYCKVGWWGANGRTQEIGVYCFDKSGRFADTPFALSYTNRTAATGAYVWSSDPTAASYTPSPQYQANSTGALNTITRNSAGSYEVRLPNLAASAGHVQVTGYGGDPQRCKVARWGPSGTAQQVSVRCFTTSGVPADTYFTLTYVRDGNVIGGSVCCHSDGHHTVYAWADQPAVASYTPNTNYQFADFGRSTVKRLGVGYYQLISPVSIARQGNAQVTAYGFGTEHCKLSYWGNDVTQPGEVRVRCWSAQGSPVDTQFDVSYVSPMIIG
jgi:hypothetical protein